MNEETSAGNDSAVWIKEYKQKLFEDECVQYFLNLEISDVEKPLLFTINPDPNIESELDNDTVPKKLREEINRELGEIFGWDDGDFSVKKSENEDEWIVRWELNVERDNKKKKYIKEFRLKKNGDNLGIYEQDSDFVRLVREAIMDVPIPDTEEEWKDFIKKTKEIRKILAVSHTIMDLLLFFSDYFPESIKDEEKEHKRRVRNYKNLLKLKEKINDEYIKKLESFAERIEKNGGKIIIVVPMFPNISIQSFSILSELSWLRSLIIKEEEDRKSLRENVEIHILFLNKPFLSRLKNIDENKQKFFFDYRIGRRAIEAELKLNKLRIESFIKRYLMEYILKEMEEIGERGRDEIMKLPKWLGEHVKTFDQRVVIDNFWDRRIEVGKEEKEEGIVDDVVKCDDETLKEINKYLKQNKKVAERSYYLSDVGVPKLLEFDTGGKEEEKASYKDILYYLKKIEKSKDLIILIQSSRALVLYNFYIDKYNKKSFLGWDSYIPMTKPPVIPIFQYLSTHSKDYNFPLAKMYEKYIYGGVQGKYIMCYLAHYLEFLFKDIFEMFGMIIKGPKCRKGRYESDTIIVKEDCDRLKESGKCGTKHWVFECTSHWEEHAPCGTISDYLWLPVEIYYAMEKIFLDIPYTFMLAKREYRLYKEGEGEEREEDFEKFFPSKSELLGHLKEQRIYIGKQMKK